MIKQAVASVVVLSTAVVLLGCGAEEKDALPSVVGIPLDEAHNRLKADDFKKFDDQDAFGDRSIALDANWVVLRQEPPAGTPLEHGKTIRLLVGKIAEQRAIEQLPTDSPVRLEQQRKQAAQAPTSQPAPPPPTPDAEHLRILRAYVADIDPTLRLGVRTFEEVRTVGVKVEADAYGPAQTDLVGASLDITRMMRNNIASRKPPKGSKRAGTHDQLVTSCDQLVQAMETLLSADGSLRADSVRRYKTVRKEAVAGWNNSVKALYAETDVQPPLVPQ